MLSAVVVAQVRVFLARRRSPDERGKGIALKSLEKGNMLQHVSALHYFFLKSPPPFFHNQSASKA